MQARRPHRQRRFPFPAPVLGLLVAAACHGGPEPRPSGPEPGEVVAALEQALVGPVQIEGRASALPGLEARQVHHRVPAVSVAVIHGGRLAWAKAWGLADVEGAVPATEDTLFQAASISKPVAAMAALDLVESGRLSLDGDVNDALTSWRVPDHPWSGSAPVSVRGLVTHTAGLTVHGFPGYGPDASPPDTRGVLEGRGNTDAVRVDLEPRSEWRYSGGGYTVLQLLLEEVTGEAFTPYLERTVLGPHGMDRSTYAQPLPRERRPAAAHGYRRDGRPVAGGWHVYPEQAAAGLWTTPTDLARWLLALQAAREGGEHPVLSAETIELLLTPDLGDWGLGPAIEGDGLRFGHGGANEGFRCRMTAYLDRGEGAVVMTNSDSGSALVDEILLTLARAYGWPGLEPRVRRLAEVDGASLDALAGRYVERLTVVTVDHREGRLWARASWDPSRSEIELFPASETEFFSLDGLEVEFDRGPDGAGTRLRAGGMELERRIQGR